MKNNEKNFDLKEEIRAYWSARAATFDDSASHKIEDQFGKPCWQAFLREANGLGPNEDMHGFNVLDLASGTGEISRILCSLGAQVTGLDFSEAMHSIAKAKLKGQTWIPLLCDAENLMTLADGSFDFITTRHLAWTLTNPAAAYAEWFRVLKPGGRLLINDGDWMSPYSRTHRLKRWVANLMTPEIPGSMQNIPSDGSIRERLPYFEGLTESKMQREIAPHGFIYVTALDVRPLYREAMQALPISTRLTQSPENRFALLFEKPTSA